MILLFNQRWNSTVEALIENPVYFTSLQFTNAYLIEGYDIPDCLVTYVIQ